MLSTEYGVLTAMIIIQILEKDTHPTILTIVVQYNQVMGLSSITVNMFISIQNTLFHTPISQSMQSVQIKFLLGVSPLWHNIYCKTPGIRHNENKQGSHVA